MNKMSTKEILLFLLQFKYALLFEHNKPVPQTIWPEKCALNERILNDCNWCVCNANQQFICSARVCNEVDMFGHFTDTIADINVGMEGHGSWRSVKQACQPLRHYRRGGLHCVCDENGYWPNPVCRDTFRVFHGVEVTDYSRPTTDFKCTASKLYLFDCNVCICTPENRIDPQHCTKDTCSSSDPVLSSALTADQQSIDIEDNLSEVYATCDYSLEYYLGCKRCSCLKNNRLVCDSKCHNETTLTKKDGKSDLCSNRTLQQKFSVDCNFCVCDKNGFIYCTVKKCLKHYSKPAVELIKTVDLNLRMSTPPLNENECVPGTKYKDDCNTCFCTENEYHKKILSCTKKYCRKNPSLTHKLRTSCVENTVYQVNCLICRCDAIDGVKRESCEMKPECSENDITQDEAKDLLSLSGYCEPFHTYKKGCNTCKCMADGKIVECTTDICEEEEKPITVEIVPVSQKGGIECRSEGMYQVDCNFCFCLSDGNILCTTAKC